MDGMPNPCSRVLRAINSGLGYSVTVIGFATSPQLSQFTASYSAVTTTGSRYRLPPTTTYTDKDGNTYTAYGQPSIATVQFVIVPGFQLGFEPNPQKPGVEFLRDTGPNHSYDPSREDRIEKAITALYTAECTKAFEDLGLESPMSLVNRKGVVVGPSTLSQNKANAAYVGVPESSLAKLKPYVGRSDLKAGTVRGELTSDGRGRILLNASAFPAGLVGVFAHEFMHLAGVEGRDPTWPWQDDLSFDKKYQEAIDACIKAAKPFNADAK